MDKILKKLLEDGLINQKTYKTLQRWPQAKLISFLNILIKDEQIAIHDQEGTSIKEIDPNEVESALEGRYIDISIPVPESLQDYQEAKLDDYIERYKPTPSTEIKRLPDGTYGEVTEYKWELAPQYQDKYAGDEAKPLPPTVSKAEIESQMGAAFEEDTTTQTSGMAGLPQEEIARAPIGRLEGAQYEAYSSLITEQGMTPEQAYQRVTGQNLAGFVTDANGDVVFEKIGDKFVPVPVTAQPDSLFMVNFVDHIARQNPEAINELKSFLVTMGVAEEEDFDDSGEMDNNLRGILGQLMQNANYKYSHVMFGSNEYLDLANSVPGNFGWVEDKDMNAEKVSWALLGRAIMDYKTDSQFVEDADVKAKEKEFEQIKDIPGSAYMSRRIDAIFEEELKRPPTDEERNKYINDWNSQYDNWAQNQAYAYRAATYGADMERYLTENGKAITATEEQAMRDDIQAGGDVLTGLIGSREKEVIKRDDEDIKEEIYYQIEQDLKSEADYIEAGKNKRTHQSNLIGLMTGKL